MATKMINVSNKKINSDLDPSALQALASDPRSHVWVGASAGTGKTKVLTDRVLRLMLPAKDHVPVDPTRILCITFTKAAAAEMASRIQEMLSEWVRLDDEALRGKVEVLTSEEATKETLTHARQLFAKVVDEGARMKIMTIHAFCESVLKRFPLEADLSPDFEVIDERQSREILQEVIFNLFAHQAGVLQNEILDEAIAYLSTRLNEEQFQDLMKMVVSNRSYFAEFIRQKGSLESAIEAIFLYNNFDNQLISKTEVLSSFAKNIDWEQLNRIAEILLIGGKSEVKIGISLKEAVTRQKQNEDYFESFYKALLTQKGQVYAKYFNKTTAEKYVSEADYLNRVVDLFLEVVETFQRLNQAQATRALLIIGYIVIQGYEEEKKHHSYLDFDDLITKTVNLFSYTEQASWVLYKLDGGIDHILVDEAQDTSPDQWSVIRSMSEEFFSGLSRNETVLKRTLFVVGDEKQSIYSFQKADPIKFNEMKNFYADKIHQLQDELNVIPLNTSFRSTDAVLKTVDDVFALPNNKKGVTLEDETVIEHFVHRQGQAGHVEIWPLALEKKSEATEGWLLPTQITKKTSHLAVLADKIAEEIAEWLKVKKILSSKNRPIKPSDIMILLQKRSGLMHPILKALKNRNVPVSGLDRLKISDEIIVKDLMAVMRFALLPQDDLSLACFLKSPFIGMSEDELMQNCLGREGTLWANLCSQEHFCVPYLKELVKMVASTRPYEFLAHILTVPCPASKVSGLSAVQARLGMETIDPMNEFLNLSLQFEQLHVPAIQDFVEWFELSDDDVKREGEGSDEDLVRIMTVHGSKGLQAPIVILADATHYGAVSSGGNRKTLFWVGKDKNMPLWALNAKDEDPHFKQIRKTHDIQADEEYKRLLYVAMTRAADQLIIAGAVKDEKKLNEQSWYHMVKSSLELKPEPFITEDESELWSDTEKLVYTTEQLVKVDLEKDKAPINADITALPQWIDEPAPYVDNLVKPLTPSKVDEAEPAMLSPLEKKEETRRFLRGNILHALLQFLPEMTLDKREQAAHLFIQKQWPDLSPSARGQWVVEISAVLNNPDFKHVFGPGSRAEVPVSGILKGRSSFVLNGKIDRLVILEDRILIVDYKTNRPPPLKVADVPIIYMKQMAIYKQALQEIYPNHKVETALLWTDCTHLMILSEDNIDPYMLSH